MARPIDIVVFDGVMSLDAFGPLEVFNTANALETAGGRPAPYAPRFTSVGGRPVTCTSGPTFEADGPLADLADPPDTVIVAGGRGARSGEHPELVAWLGSVEPRRLASVCSGAFLLAEAGVLDGRTATTHWSLCSLLGERFPEIDVVGDPIHVGDGQVFTSAGVTAGMDLSLSFVESDCGPQLALEVARHLVMFVVRPGGQAQFSAQLTAAAASTEPIAATISWIADHPEADLSVAALAARAHLSERQFARRFRDETGTTVAKYVESARLDVARRLLEATDMAISEVARGAGLGTADTLRRAFLRRLSVNPSDYRDRFRLVASGSN